MLARPNDFQRRLLRWYDIHQRALPWRLAKSAPACARLDPYHVMVSEAMLQQTQVATVIPYFQRFIARFPTICRLANADEQEVLRIWQGLGYYSRARNLQKAAKQIIAEHGGQVPARVAQLLELPGIGRYSAGAIASIAHGIRAPIIDGNVARAICRLDRIESDPRATDTKAILWKRAEAILPKTRVGDFNSALMELGATVCVPRNPACLVCPVQAHCEAFKAGVQDRIPPPRKQGPMPLERRWTFCIRSGETWLIEQRPTQGRWGGLWQFVTVEAGTKNGRVMHARSVAKCTGVKAGRAKHLGSVNHGLSHRRYEFEVYECETSRKCASGERVWVALSEMEKYPMSRPQMTIVGMLASATTSTSKSKAPDVHPGL
jgi:A/G-specific adenine glycosylase